MSTDSSKMLMGTGESMATGSRVRTIEWYPSKWKPSHWFRVKTYLVGNEKKLDESVWLLILIRSHATCMTEFPPYLQVLARRDVSIVSTTP
jgi:hypothetical protein